MTSTLFVYTITSMNLRNRTVIIWLLIGLAIRVVLSFITFHPDFTAFQLAGSLVAQNPLTMYDYLFTLPANAPLREAFATNVFTYPPFIYWYHGLINIVWVTIFQMHFMNSFIIVNQQAMGDPLFMTTLLLRKSFFLIFDFLTLWYLVKLVDNQRQKFAVMLLWIFNPVDLYATYMMGQFEIIPVFFMVLSLYYAKINRLYVSSLALGFGIAFKIFPIFVLPVLLMTTQSWMKRFNMFLLAIVPYVLGILIYLPSHGYRSTALLANQSLKSLYATIPVSGGEMIYLFPAALLFFYFLYYYRGLYLEMARSILWQNYFVILLLFFIFTHTHPQWFLWITPFMALSLVRSGYKSLLPNLGMLASFVGLTFFFDPSLTIGLFAPIAPNLYNSKSIWDLLGVTMDYTYMRSLLQTVFVGCAAYLIYRYTKQDGGVVEKHEKVTITALID